MDALTEAWLVPLDPMHGTTADWSLCSKCNYWLQQSGKPGLIKIRDDGK